MKTISVLTLILTAALFFSCKKNDPTANKPPTSQWSFDSTVHNGVSTYFITSVDLISLDSFSNAVDVYFPVTPTSNGTYTVTANPPRNGQCIVGISENSDSYTSIGSPGDTVTVTVSAGKVTAAFSNISVSDGYATKTVSGTLIQQ